MNTKRHFTWMDRLCLSLDQALRTLSNASPSSGKVYPAQNISENALTNKEREHSAGLMRVNHAGEVCAQALYHGQAMVSRSNEIQIKMQQSAMEEGDHLAWCKQRLDELGSHTSYLNPFWYAGSFCIGIVAGMIGDDWSLGFVTETECQVIKHLEGHLHLLPMQDQRSYKIIQQMEADEAKHRDEAIESGARDLPEIIKKIMNLTSKVMVKTSYYF